MVRHCIGRRPRRHQVTKQLVKFSVAIDYIYKKNTSKISKTMPIDHNMFRGLVDSFQIVLLVAKATTIAQSLASIAYAWRWCTKPTWKK